ncbi:MAG: site-specific integrase [bacterium]|nr:site-specific integrase [bacterium]
MSISLKTRSAKAAGVVIRRQRNATGDHLYLDIHEGAIRVREFLRLYLTGDKSRDREAMLMAEKIRSNRLEEMQARRSGLVLPSFDLARDFMPFYSALADTKGKVWKNTLFHLNNFQSKPLRFVDLSAEWIHAFRDYLGKRDLAANTVATYLDVIKTALNIAVRQHIIPQNPFVFADRIQRKRTRRVFLTLEELQLLSSTTCSHPDVKRAFLTACLTGLRISDLRGLTWSQVKSDGLHIVQKKTGDYTHIPLADEALSLLGERPSKKSALVFTLPKTDDLFNRYLKRWVKVAGVDKHVTSHIARHTFATLLITQGNDLYSVQHLLGHRDIRVTQLYAKLVDEKKKYAVMSLPTIGSAKVE